MTLHELATYLNNYLEISHFDEAAYNGMQVANTGQITKVATAVSATLETMHEAKRIGAQALIVHHGIFRKTDMHPIVDIHYKKIAFLMHHNIGLLAYHLPLDAHQEVGNNWYAARCLGLSDLRPFGHYGSRTIGVIGLMSPMPFDQFKSRVETYYGRTAQCVKVKDMIHSVAIISGGADRFLIDAAQAGADCFITGRVDEPVWADAHEHHISFLGLGHYGTEIIGPQELAKHIEKACNMPAICIKTDNPF